MEKIFQGDFFCIFCIYSLTIFFHVVRLLINIMYEVLTLLQPITYECFYH
ncbi:Uncharacterised protein [Escherichia coli]|uniref:Uncharacterized protein n=1 Tax=Escherichia coli TaxID=562 RepID=A0A0K5ZVX4_ECOLX|nr:Uncharacterised protein [Escherichia coli]CTT09467.1 Uncharacterised protein [Escherichia coli]CTT24312.1 Uncharacterised protein [Escherichia coli]CTT65971.1 Uncharacterised protein [Escherichia coli]CTU11878.1 Uncharacterised protein [Escherichia coli]